METDGEQLRQGKPLGDNTGLLLGHIAIGPVDLLYHGAEDLKHTLILLC